MSAATRRMDFAALVDELLDHVEHAEDTTWAPTREAIAAVAARAELEDAARHPRPEVGPEVPPGFGRAARGPGKLPARRDRRRTVRAPGLVAQLEDLEGHAWAAAGDTSIRSTPESRTPPGGRAVEATADLQAAVLAVWADLAPAGARRPRDAWAALRGLVGVAADLDEPALDVLVAHAQSWVRGARLTLGWDVPTVALPDTYCPECLGFNTLRVPADLSRAVFCISVLLGPVLEGEPWPLRCGAVWPRSRWLFLLDEARRREQEAS